jgi:hypothetical protein
MYHFFSHRRAVCSVGLKVGMMTGLDVLVATALRTIPAEKLAREVSLFAPANVRSRLV